ncbi:hypothetical protein U9M48_009158 [Paspalum notatum var. saurae]|uniref:Uncharacterized protein n=1 Tax=Paspalum notatum var. saurae TaxID=547442 RepID=A0AAQ3SQS0_PASNO
MEGLGLFNDIGKKAKDLLTKGYTCDQAVTLSSATASGVSLTSTAVKKGGHYHLDMNSEYKNEYMHIGVKVDVESNISATFTVLKVLPSTRLAISFMLPDYNARKISTTFTVSEALPYRNLVFSVKLPDDPLKLKLRYFHENASFATEVRMKPSPAVKFSGAVGAQGVAFGAECRYDTSRGEFRKYKAAIGVAKKHYHAALVLSDKGDTIKVYSLYHFDKKQKTSAVAELTRKFSTNQNTLTIGYLYTVDAQTTVKARFSSAGRLATLLHHKINQKSHLTISGEFDTKALDRHPKIGLALVLNP